MDSSSNPFRSERLTYRAIEDNSVDLEFIHSISLDAEGFANSNSSALVPQNREATKRWKQHLDGCIIAAIVCLPSGVPIGLVSLSGSSGMRTAQHRSANISIDILPAHQRRGYGSEAVRWVTGWGFQAYGLHRVGIESFSHNEGACRLYERLGFVPEQRRREALWFRGGWSDVLGFAMLEDEWREREGGGGGRRLSKHLVGPEA